MRVEAVNRAGNLFVRLTRLEPKGGKYPDVIVELPVADFPSSNAVDEVAKELAKK